MPNPTHLIIIGNDHSDFTLPHLLKRTLTNMVKRKIPCAYLVECPSGLSIDDIIAEIQDDCRLNDFVRNLLPEMEGFLKTDPKSGYSYFPDDASDKMADLLIKNAEHPGFKGQLSDPDLFERTRAALDRNSAHMEELLLYKTLQELQVPFAGIDVETVPLTVTGQIAQEAIRIQTMVDNIFEQIQPFQETGGIFFIPVGENHAHRLAAYLQQKINAMNMTSVHVHPFIFGSEYVCKIDPDDPEYAWIKKQVELNADTAEIQELYARHPIQHVDCSFENGMFTAQKLEAYIQRLIDTLQPLQAPQCSVFYSGAPHDKLLAEVQHYLEVHPRFLPPAKLMPALQDKQYSLAIRNACASGETGLVKIFIRYCESLKIDLTVASSNGNTALMWFKASKASVEDKVEVLALLGKFNELKTIALT